MIEHTKEESKQVEIIKATVARGELTHLRHASDTVIESGNFREWVHKGGW